MTIAFIAQKGRKAGIGIETRPAKPVERPRAINERHGLAVTYDSIIFDIAGQLAGLDGTKLDDYSAFERSEYRLA
jgi:hypothetical protein